MLLDKFQFYVFGIPSVKVSSGGDREEEKDQP